MKRRLHAVYEKREKDTSSVYIERSSPSLLESGDFMVFFVGALHGWERFLSGFYVYGTTAGLGNKVSVWARVALSSNDEAL